MRILGRLFTSTEVPSKGEESRYARDSRKPPVVPTIVHEQASLQRHNPGADLLRCPAGAALKITPTPNSAELLASPNNDKAPAQPKVLSVSQQNAKATFDDLRRHGYIMFAESSFYGPASKTTNDEAVEQAQKVGAALRRDRFGDALDL